MKTKATRNYKGLQTTEVPDGKMKLVSGGKCWSSSSIHSSKVATCSLLKSTRFCALSDEVAGVATNDPASSSLDWTCEICSSLFSIDLIINVTLSMPCLAVKCRSKCQILGLQAVIEYLSFPASSNFQPQMHVRRSRLIILTCCHKQRDLIDSDFPG